MLKRNAIEMLLNIGKGPSPAVKAVAALMLKLAEAEMKEARLGEVEPRDLGNVRPVKSIDVRALAGAGTIETRNESQSTCKLEQNSPSVNRVLPSFS